MYMHVLLTSFSILKEGVDAKRWSLALCYNMLDIAALASYIIYTENYPSHYTTKKGNYF